ncbi:MAG TPA: DUF4160 domain-containing protein [Verrucomicrobiae bacterium]|nr:DUF4160 domain-containing protein [Verrucomicrobiae bacterium]
MSPTVFRWKGYRVFFFSREAERPHVHVQCEDGEAMFWLEPDVELAKNYGLSAVQISEIVKVLKERKDEISSKWREHFQRGSDQH